nr:EOG090X06AF [Ilyocryptus agilis]
MGEEFNPSIVEYFGADSGHKCGYCKGSTSNISHGMWAHTMSVQDYENLIDRGWRRSGQYLYKPLMNTTCCPMYTIRCDATQFQLNRSHKKVLKKVNNFLLKGTGSNKNREATASGASDVCEEVPCSIQKKADKSETVVEDRGEGAEAWKLRGSQKKAKILRLEKKMQKTGDTTTQARGKNEGKSLEEYLEVAKSSTSPAHFLEVKLLNTSSEEFKDSLVEAHKLYVKYQMAIHKDEEDECNMEQFKRFLVKSPLQRLNANDNGLVTGYGSFHQNYLLDGKLVAVGVIDILPSCLSSVYFFYDPDYSFLSLGTYASLREIAFVRELHKNCPDFSWYYLGFYIHSCPKMVYKGQYKPSYLLCPEAYTWHPFNNCVPKLDRSKYARLEDPEPSQADGVNKDVQLSEVGILFNRRAMTYGIYSRLSRQFRTATDADEVREYASLVGMETARRILLYRS